jgi:predicted phosphodiesterase
MSEPHRIGEWETGSHGQLPSITRGFTRADRGRIMFVGDLHLDSAHCDRGALKYALDQAVEADAPIVILGDVFDAMQSKGDRRANKAALMERYYGRDDYLNAMLEDAESFLAPYARHIWIMLHGNHDADMVKYHETDLVRLLAVSLNRQGASIATPGYQTHIAIKPRISTSKYGELVLGYITHGSGGNAPQTGGVLNASRRAAWVPQADFFVSGHLHRPFDFSTGQVRVSQSGKVYKQWVDHVQVGAWKNESESAASWANMRGMPPSPVGPAYWLELRQARGEKSWPKWRTKFVRVDA